MSTAPLLKATGLYKNFGGVQATVDVHRADFEAIIRPSIDQTEAEAALDHQHTERRAQPPTSGSRGSPRRPVDSSAAPTRSWPGSLS